MLIVFEYPGGPLPAHLEEGLVFYTKWFHAQLQLHVSQMRMQADHETKPHHHQETIHGGTPPGSPSCFSTQQWQWSDTSNWKYRWITKYTADYLDSLVPALDMQAGAIVFTSKKISSYRTGYAWLRFITKMIEQVDPEWTNLQPLLGTMQAHPHVDFCIVLDHPLSSDTSMNEI